MKTKGIICSLCSHVYKWCDERLPNYCPECGGQMRELTDISEMGDSGPKFLIRGYYKVVEVEDGK